MHHSDADFNLSIGFRFRPVRSVLNQAIFLFVVVVFFGTYRKRSVIGEGPISVGLETLPDSRRLSWWELWLMPVRVQEPIKLGVLKK